ncbi:MAG TPA: hypothetical protein VGN81_25785 [Pseudonocardiaceae bacterium]|jgi:hypothetical protein
MTALFRYTAAILFHSQRYVAPVLVFLLGAGAFVHGDAHQPAVPVFGAMAGVEFAFAIWLTVSLVNVEDPVQRTITAVNTGRSWSMLVASALVVLACCLVLDALVLAIPVVFDFTGLTGLDLVAGGEALLTGACAGIALGLLTSRLVIRRIGFALLAILVLFVGFLVVPWLPPIHPMIFLLAGHSSATGGLIASTSAYTAIAIVMLVASVLVTQQVAARRD